MVFGMTDFWRHLKDPEVHKMAAKRVCSANEIAFEREIAQGKVCMPHAYNRHRAQNSQALIDAVTATLPSLDQFIFSTLSSARVASKGAISFNFHFDSKADMVNYLKTEHPELWAKTSLLTLGCYAGNWKLYKERAGRPEKVSDCVFKLCLPMDGHRALPFVEPNDTGRCLMSDGSPILIRSQVRLSKRFLSCRLALILSGPAHSFLGRSGARSGVERITSSVLTNGKTAG